VCALPLRSVVVMEMYASVAAMVDGERWTSMEGKAPGFWYECGGVKISPNS
jgi:hypothetical protein